MPTMVLTSEIRAELVRIAWEMVSKSIAGKSNDAAENLKEALDLFTQAYEGLVTAEAKIINTAANTPKDSK